MMRKINCIIGKNDSLLIFFLLIFSYGYFYTHGGHNQNSRLGLTFSIVETLSFSLNASSIEDAESPFFTGDFAVVNGRYYSDKAPGSSFLAALIYFPIRFFDNNMQLNLDIPSKMHLLTFLVISLSSALAGTLVYLFSRTLSKSKFKAIIVTLAIALGTLCFPFSTTFFGHQLAGSLLFISFYLIFQIKQQSKEKPVNGFRSILIGLLMGMAFQVEYLTAMAILPLILYYFIILWQSGKIKHLNNIARPFVAGIFPILMLMVYNKIVFGGILKIGYQFLSHRYFQEEMSKGIMGITRPKLSVFFYETLHPAYGIFSLSPVLLLIFIGAFYVFYKKQNRLELVLSFMVCTGFLLANSGYAVWWGGSSLGPRAVIPMLPFLCIPLIFVPKKWDIVFIVLTSVSIFQMTLAVASNFLVPADYIEKIAEDPIFNHSLLYGDCLVQLMDGRFSWNIGQNWLGVHGFASLLPLIIVQIILINIFFASSDSKTVNLNESKSINIKNIAD